MHIRGIPIHQAAIFIMGFGMGAMIATKDLLIVFSMFCLISVGFAMFVWDLKGKKAKIAQVKVPEVAK